MFNDLNFVITYVLKLILFYHFVTGDKRQRTEYNISDHSDKDIPSSKHESTDKHISLDSSSKPPYNISSRRGKDPASGRSRRRKVISQKLIAEKQFLNPDHENVDHYAKKRPHKRTSPLPPLTKDKKFKGLLDIC